MKFPKLYNVEYHFSESVIAERQFRDTLFGRKSFCRMYFSRIVIKPNAIIPNRRLAEHHFPENALSGMNTIIQSKPDFDCYCY